MKARWQPTARDLALIAALVALDLSLGVVTKHLLGATGMTNALRLDMLVPVALFVIARESIDHFGCLVLYEAAWGILAMLFLPMTVVPGPLKLVPLLLQGATMDAAFSLTRRLGRLRPHVAVIAGGFVSHVVVFSFRVWVLGLPWSRLTKVLFGVQQLSSVIIGVGGVLLAHAVLRRVHGVRSPSVS